MPVASKDSSGTAVIGVQVQEQYKFPINVQITVGDIGGPSAGMMFALGIIDKLTKDNLTGGKFIAGPARSPRPGRSSRSAASSRRWWAPARPARPSSWLRRATARPPRARCPPGLRVVRVSTLSQAVSDLEAIKANKPVPSC